jgi:hypothetical protein
MMQSAEYFALASHEDQRQATKGSKSTSGCRANSKQIGEEIASKERNNEKTLTSDANDPSRMWPLLCHELTMTMDQEDRIINQAHDQLVLIQFVISLVASFSARSYQLRLS